MTMRVLLALLAVTWGLVSGAAPALASSNASSTQTYVKANYALVHVAKSHLTTSEGGPLEVLAKVKGECPAAGAGSPQDAESTQMSDEVIGTIVIAAAQPDLQAIRTFIRTASSLTWSSSALTDAVHAYANKLKTVLSLTPPSLCTEVKAWGASGYHALPATTVAFVGKFMPAWVALGFLPSQLARYENGATRALANRAGPLEQELSEGEARAVEHWGDIMDTLMIWP
jgi:hypothetical protein